MEKKTSLFDNGLIWFGAGVSLAEILIFPPWDLAVDLRLSYWDM